MSSLLDASAFELARRIRAGELTSVAVVQAHVDRIRRVNGAINAVVATRFDQALVEARAADARVAAAAPGDVLPPLLGVPCTIKEFFAVAGLPQTGGWWDRRAEVATEDAELVRRLRDAGAIVLGVTNVPELGMWMETHNTIYGRTSNPWDLRRTSGGSSGGEAAILAAGGAPFGLGSDIGGSIRIPAAFCGVAGHKPTGGLLPSTGHWPDPRGDADTYMCSGPMARHVSDLHPLLRILSNDDPRVGEPRDVRLEDVTLHVAVPGGHVRLERGVRDALERSARALEARGARRVDLEVRGLDKALGIWAAMIGEADDRTFAQLLAGGADRFPLGREAARMLVGRSRYTAASLAVVLVESLSARLPRAPLVEAGRVLRAELEEALGPRGVLLYPPYSRTAPRHVHALVRTPFDFVCTAIFNVLGFPGTVVPVGFDRRGLPLAVQVVGRRGADALTLAVAEALERAVGGWVRAEPGVRGRVSQAPTLAPPRADDPGGPTAV